MLITFKIQNGATVVDSVSDVTGVVDACIVKITGSICYSIQPKSKDKSTMPDGWTLDEQQLESFEPKSHEVKFKFAIGDKVKENITGYIGTIKQAAYWLNQCITYQLQAEGDGKSIPDHLAAPEGTLELIEASKLNLFNEKKTGGQKHKTERI